MKQYWFYGISPSDIISEDALSEKQNKIIKKELSALSKKNLYEKWIGYNIEGGWKFMRHGFEVVFINEEKGNIARNKLFKILRERYL